MIYGKSNHLSFLLRPAVIVVLSSMLAAGCTAAPADTGKMVDEAQASVASAKPAEKEPARSGMTMGNGDKNWIIVDGATRTNNTLRFKEVHIDGNGWLVMHPFEGGKPNGDKYVASTYVKDGANKNVDIEVFKGVATGEMFIVMLHRDVNENQVLDFVFVDDRNVMDTAVFEGTKMIAHAFPAP